ncbi:MAG TPA: hypothetical protein PLJ21_06515, partial [Pseudobdellovibrionaceae bacterium]|nr:hypothetical protein [Pseudobdellovibrionaceae bacterium]
MKKKSTPLFQWLRRLGYLMGGVFLCLILIVSGLIWYIQTPEGTKKTLSAADQFLRKNHNGNFTFSNAKINLVHGQLQIENLKANISFNENFQIQIESPLFNFEFSVSELLDHRIFIKILEVQELKSKIISLENADESMDQDPKKKNFKIPILNTYKEKLQNIISKNPISIDIPDLKLSIKEFILIKNSIKTIEIQNASLQSQLHWDDNSFQFNYSTEIQPKGFAQYFSTQSAMGLKENSKFKLTFEQNKSKEIKLHQLEGVLYLLPLKVSSQEFQDIVLSFDKQSIGITIPNFNYKLKDENLKTENSLFNAPVILESKWTYQFSNLFQDLKIEQILKINNHQVLTFKTALDLAGIKNNPSELQIHINKSISKISSLLKPLIPWADLSVEMRGTILPLEKALNEPISTLSLEGKLKSGHSQFIFLQDPLDFKLELLLEAQRLQWDLNFSHQKNMNSSFLNFFSAGTYFKNEHRFYASSYIKAHFKKDQNYIKNFDLLGEFQMPFYINFRKNKYEAEGSMVFSNLSITSPQFNFINIKGSIPFKESFELCNMKVCFKNPIASNAFERADFEQIQPLIKSSAPLSIETIKI